MYEDKTLICKECGQEFIFTAGEQEFYAEKGFVNEPQRCKPCRDARTRRRLTAKCLWPPVQHADRKPGFLLSPEKTALYIAVTVSQK